MWTKQEIAFIIFHLLAGIVFPLALLPIIFFVFAKSLPEKEEITNVG